MLQVSSPGKYSQKTCIGLLLTPIPSLQGSALVPLCEEVDSHDLFWKVSSQNGTGWNEECVWAGTIHCSLSEHNNVNTGSVTAFAIPLVSCGNMRFVPLFCK